MQVHIRPMLERDEGFVIKTWLDGFRDSHYSGVLPFREYKLAHRLHFNDVLGRPDVGTSIAIDPTQEDPRLEILGCLVVERWELAPIIHWMFVPRQLRRAGIATALMGAGGAQVDRLVITCKTRKVIEIQKARPSLRLHHDPRFLRDPQWKERNFDPSTLYPLPRNGDRSRQAGSDDPVVVYRRPVRGAVDGV